MKFTCDKSSINASAATAARAASVKNAVPALEGLLVEAFDSDVRISGYDLRTGIVTSVSADVEETGSIVLNAKLFGEIIRRLPDGPVTIEAGENLTTYITGGMSRFEIIGSSAAEYPELPSVESQNYISVPEGLLKSMIAQTNFAVSYDESRPIHTGSLFETEGGTLTIVSVDGFRLALRREHIGSGDAPCSFVVPGAALSEVEKILGDSDGLVSIHLGMKHIMFELGDTILISRRLEGEFLNYKNSIPKTGKYYIEASKRELISCVERVSLIINEKLKSPVRCTFEDGLLKMLTLTALGRASDECPVKGDGEGLEIGFNNRYLLEALKAAPADDVKLVLTSGTSPCVIIPGDDSDSFLYMILPVRLKAHEG